MKIQEAADDELMFMVRGGNMSALEELVRRYQDRVVSFAYRFSGRWDMAEDIRQETFLRVWKSSKEYSPKGKFVRWVYSIVTNLCVDEHRKKIHLWIPIEEAGGKLATESDCDALEAEERTRIVRNAVMELSERQRAAVILHRYDGLSHTEISEVTGWSRSAVESLLVRAYANLRNKLGAVAAFGK